MLAEEVKRLIARVWRDKEIPQCPPQRTAVELTAQEEKSV